MLQSLELHTTFTNNAYLSASSKGRLVEKLFQGHCRSQQLPFANYTRLGTKLLALTIVILLVFKHRTNDVVTSELCPYSLVIKIQTMVSKTLQSLLTPILKFLNYFIFWSFLFNLSWTSFPQSLDTRKRELLYRDGRVLSSCLLCQTSSPESIKRQFGTLSFHPSLQHQTDLTRTADLPPVFLPPACPSHALFLSFLLSYLK